jgi:hypothetical protein
MGAALLRGRSCRQKDLPGLRVGREIRRSEDRNRSVIGRHASGVESVLRAACGVATLDDLIASTWAGLSAGDAVSCPACGGERRSATRRWLRILVSRERPTEIVSTVERNCPERP